VVLRRPLVRLVLALQGLLVRALQGLLVQERPQPAPIQFHSTCNCHHR
jgi:hypothetical protein